MKTRDVMNDDISGKKHCMYYENFRRQDGLRLLHDRVDIQQVERGKS
jgi:hypothetical protein